MPDNDSVREFLDAVTRYVLDSAESYPEDQEECTNLSAVESMLDSEEAGVNVATIDPRPDFIVEVFWNPGSQCFFAKLKARLMPEALELELEEATPGDALTVVGNLLDVSLARRGFKRGCPDG